MPQRFLRLSGIKSYQVSIRENFGAEFGQQWHHHGTNNGTINILIRKSIFVSVSIVQILRKSRRFTSCHVLIHRWWVTWSCRPICFQSFLDAGQGISRSWVKVTMSQRSVRSVWLKNKKRDPADSMGCSYDIQMDGFHMFSSFIILVTTCSNMFRPCWARHATWDQPAMPRNQLRALLHPVILELPNTEMSTTFRNSFRIHQHQNYSISIHIHHLSTSIYILNRSKMI